MIYPARGGLDWGQMRGVLSKVRGVYTPLGGLYNILPMGFSPLGSVRHSAAAPGVDVSS